MATNILKEAIADAKAVREVALANAKAALEEAFTPKLQSMLSAKLSEELDEEFYDEDEEMDEMVDLETDSYEEGIFDEEGFEDNMDETYYDEEEGEEDSMDEEIDLEEILNELELEGSDDEEDLDEEMAPIYKADDPQKGSTKAEYVHEDKEFDLDSLLKEINDLDDDSDLDEDLDLTIEDDELTEIAMYGDPDMDDDMFDEDIDDMDEMDMDFEIEDNMMRETKKGCGCKKENTQLQETRKAYNHVKTELNEVNLLNSKLLYVNRIFKANDLSEAQKLRVVETLDKAESTKEAKLIYETVKDTFTISKKKKTTPKKSIRENFGMASKSSGTTQSSARKNSIISESNDMVARFKKLANIKIN